MLFSFLVIMTGVYKFQRNLRPKRRGRGGKREGKGERKVKGKGQTEERDGWRKMGKRER